MSRSEDGEFPERVSVLNLWAVAGLVVAGLVGAGGLFILPALRDWGIDFLTGFLIACGVEGGAALLAAVCITRLHVDRV